MSLETGTSLKPKRTQRAQKRIHTGPLRGIVVTDDRLDWDPFGMSSYCQVTSSSMVDSYPPGPAGRPSTRDTCTSRASTLITLKKGHEVPFLIKSSQLLQDLELGSLSQQFALRSKVSVDLFKYLLVRDPPISGHQHECTLISKASIIPEYLVI